MDLYFYYDIVCPYAYMASRRVEALAKRTGATLHWRPVLLGGVYRSIGRQQEATAGQSDVRQQVGALDLLRQAERQGVSLVFPSQHPRRTVNAMRLILAAPPEKRPILTHALYRTYWEEGRDVSDPNVLAEVATAHGIDPACTQDPAIKQALFDAVEEAVSHGVFGVPGFVVDGKLFWGVDRMHLVEKALGGSPVWPPQRTDEPLSPVTLTFFHDFSSPYSYLGATQVEKIAQRNGATLEWAPMLLGGLFRSIGTEGIPMAGFSPPKQRYGVKDMQDWADWWGVPFTFASQFPLRTVAALRVAIQDPATTLPIYRAAWAEDRNIGDPEVLRNVLVEAGFDADALLAGTQDPAVKAVLRENTERAQALGTCGAPTFVINGEVVLWGQDRADQVEAALHGWRPRDMG